MGQDLVDRVAIVTGAGTGIGRATAQRFAEEGAAVVITGRRKQLLEETQSLIADAGHGKCLVMAGDMSSEADVERIFADTARELGKLDVLVNNAAIAGEVGKIWELELADFQEALQINLAGPWLCTRAAARLMMPRRYGKIINIGSITGKRPLDSRTPYTTTKLGLVGLTKTVALELGEFDINVNNISPGAVNTPRLAELAEKGKIPLAELLENVGSAAALKRVNSSEDIAEIALFLATDRSKSITGFDITADSGIWYS